MKHDDDAVTQLAEALKARAEQQLAQAQQVLGERGEATLKEHDYVEEAKQTLENPIVELGFHNAMERLSGFGHRAPTIPPMPAPPPR